MSRWNSETAALVESVGRMQQYLAAWGETMDEARYRKSRDTLLSQLAQAEARLAAEERTWEEYGWTLSADCQWKRMGEADPAPRPLPAELDEETRALIQECRETDARDRGSL